MRKLFGLLTLILCLAKSLQAKSNPVDTIGRAKFIKQHTATADSLNIHALQLTHKGASIRELNKAVEMIMKGLHSYSRYRDSLGLRQTYDHLSLVYRLQKKHIQAKWFAIQANSMARDMRDTISIIQTLITLSEIKTNIKDYDLAKRDLNEALLLSKQHKDMDQEMNVLKAYATYYAEKGESRKSVSFIEKALSIKDSVAQAREKIRLDSIAQKYQVQQTKERILVQRQQSQTTIISKKMEFVAHQKNVVAIISLSATAAIVLAVAGVLARRKGRRRKKRKHLKT